MFTRIVCLDLLENKAVLIFFFNSTTVTIKLYEVMALFGHTVVVCADEAHGPRHTHTHIS